MQQCWSHVAWHGLQVGEGLTDFIPAPAESRRIIARSYCVPQTLLVRFADDGIDETNLIEPVLRRSNGTGGSSLDYDLIWFKLLASMSDV